MRVRTIIVLSFIAMVVTGAVIGGLFSSMAMDDILKEDVGSRLRALSESRAKHVETFIDQSLERLSLVSSRTKLRQSLWEYLGRGDPAELDAARGILADAKRSVPDFTDITIVGEDGRAIVSTSAALESKDYSREEFFARGREEDGLYLLSENGEPTIYLSGPLYLDNNFLGVIIITEPATTLFAITLDAAGLGETGETYLTDREGYLLTPSRFKENTFLVQKASGENFRECIAGYEKYGNLPEALAPDKGAVSNFEDYRGKEVMGTHSYVRQNEWCMLAEIDYAEAVSGIKERLFFIALVFLAVFIAVSTVLGYWISGRIAGSLEGLTKTVDEISKGRLDISMKGSGITEIQSLARSLERVLASLKLAVLKSGISREDLELGEAIQGRIEAERKAQQYLDIVGSIIVSLDEKGKVSMINKKGAEILGYAQEAIVGKDWFENFLPPKIRDWTRDAFNKVISGEAKLAESTENLILTKGGRERLISWHSTLIRGSRGAIIGTLGSGEDITEKKKAELAMRESEEKYRKIFELSPEGIVMLDRKGRMFAPNPRLEDWTGYTPGEVKGKSVFNAPFFSNRSKAVIAKKFIERMAGKEVPPYELEFLKKSGGAIIGEIRAAPIRNEEGKITHDLIMVTNVTGDKKKERERRETERLYKMVLDTSSELIYVVDAKGKFHYHNNAFEKVLGYTHKDVEELNALKLLHPADYPKILKIVPKVISGGKKIENIEYRYRKKDGTYARISSNFAPIKDENGKRTLGVGISRDITEYREENSIIGKMPKNAKGKK